MVRVSISLLRSPLVGAGPGSPHRVAVLCAGAAGSSHYRMPWKSQPWAFLCLDIFKILKDYSEIVVRCHNRAVFDSERYVEKYIIHIFNYLVRLFPSETETIIRQ